MVNTVSDNAKPVKRSLQEVTSRGHFKRSPGVAGKRCVVWPALVCVLCRHVGTLVVWTGSGFSPVASTQDLTKANLSVYLLLTVLAAISMMAFVLTDSIPAAVARCLYVPSPMRRSLVWLRVEGSTRVIPACLYVFPTCPRAAIFMPCLVMPATTSWARAGSPAIRCAGVKT